MTVAVKVTEVPAIDGFKVEATVFVVVARFTVSMSTGEELPALLLSPPYTALIECCPAAKLDVE